MPGVGPDQLLMLGIDLPDMLIVCFEADVDGSDALLDHLDQARRDVAALAFRLEDHAAAMSRARIGTEHDEQVRKIRHSEAEIGGWIVAGPGLLEIPAAAPGDVEPRRHSVTLKPVETTMTSAGRNLPSAVTMPSRAK